MKQEKMNDWYSAQAIMRQLPARWEMHVIAENEAARRFWQKLLTASCATYRSNQSLFVCSHAIRQKRPRRRS